MNLVLVFMAVILGLGLMSYMTGSVSLSAGSAESNATNVLLDGTGILLGLAAPIGLILVLVFIIYSLTLLAKNFKGK